MTPAIVLLNRMGVVHEVLSYRHDPGVDSYGREAVELLGLDARAVFKTLVVDVEGVGLCCAVVPVQGMLDLKAMADAVGGRKARLAEQAEAERATGYLVGGISPIAQKKRLRLVLDASATSMDKIYVSAGRRGLEVAIAPTDLLRVASGTTSPISRA